MHSSRQRGLQALGLLKLLEGSLFLIAGLGAFELREHQTLGRLIVDVQHYQANIVGHLLLRVLQPLTPNSLMILGVAGLIYAGLHLTEGIGLLLRQRWAEYMTIISTSLLLPFEIYELSRKLTLVRGIAFTMNVAIVIYLIVQLWRVRRLERREAVAGES